jgi:hypothetical protein
LKSPVARRDGRSTYPDALRIGGVQLFATLACDPAEDSAELIGWVSDASMGAPAVQRIHEAGKLAARRQLG